MGIAADVIARNDGRLGDLLGVVVDKAKQACFVDIVVGLALVAIVGCELYSHAPVAQLIQTGWLLVGALAVTRAGDTLKTATHDAAYYFSRVWAHGQQMESDAANVHQTQ